MRPLYTHSCRGDIVECGIIMEDLLPSVIVQYIVVGTYEVAMVWEYQGSVQIFRSRVVF